MIPELGIIEGFYGKPWTWQDRSGIVTTLAPHGYRFYLYAPKGDAYLRRRWQEAHPEEMAAQLAAFAAHCERAGVRFGVGLSPYELYLSFDDAARAALQQKLDFFARIGVRDLAILFDDMRGDVPELAERQLEIMHWVVEHAHADRLLTCPTYYTDDPVLDRVFGARPPEYLPRLGHELPAQVEVFWTGEEVISRDYSIAHLEAVRALLGRKPFLWDNYPVNDGQRMSQYLHLRGVTGRRAAIAPHIAGHGVNPALQPTLTRIPMITLAASYRLGDRYAYAAEFRNAAREVLGEALGTMLWEDVLMLQDVGLDRLDETQVARIRERYGSNPHPAAREIIGWLEGEYRITNEIVKTQ